MLQSRWPEWFGWKRLSDAWLYVVNRCHEWRGRQRQPGAQTPHKGQSETPHKGVGVETVSSNFWYRYC